MTDPEDQVRRYAEAVTRAQRPVDIDEVTARSRRGHGRRPAAVVAALVVVAALITAVVLVGRGGNGPARVEVAPTSSSSPVANCPAASLTVTSTGSERLHPGWLPPGFVLTQGNESDIGARGGLTYSTPGTGNRPRVDLSIYRGTEPLASLYSGTTQPITVQGQPGILSVSTPHVLPLTAILWRPVPTIALVVNGYDLTDADLIRIADNVEYESGGTLSYPTHPEVAVTRAQAITAAGVATDNADAVLTSFGELDAVATDTANHFPTIAAGIAVTQPVWVVWTAPADQTPNETRATVINGAGVAVLATIARMKGGALESLTDRSTPACAPPFGVLTRSEVAYLRTPLNNAKMTATFTTERKLSSVPTLSGFLDCSLDACDPTVPVWIFVQRATDQSFTNMEFGPARHPGTTQPGSWQITMLDARTGPQNTNVSNTSSLGPGAPPAGVLTIPDLAPG